MHRQFLEYHPIFGHRFIPGLKARVEHEGGGYLMRVNESGFRCDHEFVREKQPGTFRVLLFGDSVTAGDGVSNGRRYGDVVEELIPGLEVYNFGISGTGTDQQYLIFREMAAGIEHDLVVIGVLVENVRRNVARYRRWATSEGGDVIFAKPYFTLEADGSLQLHNVPLPRNPVTRESLPVDERSYLVQERMVWLRRTVNRMGPSVRALAWRLSRYQPVCHYDRADHPAWRLMKAILLQWTSESTTPVVIVPIPIHQYIEKTASPAGYQARFRELDDPPRATVHDPLADFLRFSSTERRGFRFDVDGHLTAAGHRVLAESLASCISSHLLAEAR